MLYRAAYYWSQNGQGVEEVGKEATEGVEMDWTHEHR